MRMISRFLVSVALLAALAVPALAGFSLQNSTVPRDEILSGGPPKDGIPALLEPTLLAAAEATFLDDDDVVVGFQSGGEARAYPLRVLNWHEVVNDTVDDEPVAVTWCPLTASAVVFHRRVGEDVLTFGVSGLLYQSNVLVYDHQSESLWSQLGRGAIAGDQVGRRLTTLPAETTTWGAWRKAHPKTRVLSDQTGHRRNYAGDPYAGYHASTGLMFPPKRHDARLMDKQKVFGLTIGDDSVAYPVAHLPKGDSTTDDVGGRAIRISRAPDTDTVRAVDHATGALVDGTAMYWFAWSAFHPDTRVWTPQTSAP